MIYDGKPHIFKPFKVGAIVTLVDNKDIILFNGISSHETGKKATIKRVNGLKSYFNVNQPLYSIATDSGKRWAAFQGQFKEAYEITDWKTHMEDTQ